MTFDANKFISILISSCTLAANAADETANPGPPLRAAAMAASQDFVAIPSPTNTVQLRLFTNASPDATHLVNTLEVRAFGETLLAGSGTNLWRRWLDTSPSNTALHNLLVNGAGPRLAATNSMTVVERASGPEWTYVALDGSVAYGDRLRFFRRGVLFVEPDLFVVHDHVVGNEPVTVQMVLHPPAATRLDPIWHDLRLELPKAGFRIHAPAARHTLRSWERMENPVDGLLPGTVTMRLGPTNTVSELNMVTVFALFQGGVTNDYAFKLLESNTAVGARIHRLGLPTLVAFRIDPSAAGASLTGFGFSGPVGVDVFKPKKRAR
jgi:hypothetical protein